MGQILTLITLVLGILEKFVSWGAQIKVFKQNEAIIALHILRKAQEDIKRADEIEAELTRKFESDPNLVSEPDEFTRNNP